MDRLAILVLVCVYIGPVRSDWWTEYLEELIGKIRSPPSPSWSREYLEKQQRKDEQLDEKMAGFQRTFDEIFEAVDKIPSGGGGGCSDCETTKDQINIVNRKIDDLNIFKTTQERTNERTTGLIKGIQDALNEVFEKLDGGSTSSGGSDTYTRWGRTTCPSDSTLVYDGYSAGSPKLGKGSGANILCLPRNPEYSRGNSHRDAWVGRIFGIEYQIKSSDVYSTSFHNAEMPCAVCLTNKRSTALMIPAKRTCENGWHKEYCGYLMSAANAANRQPSEFICVDENIEAVSSSRKDNDQGNVYIVESGCGSLPCPNYKEGGELTCVVCSK